MLLVGAVDVLTGAFRAFDSRRDRISVETILASAAIPTLFRSVHLDGGVYWDGLFSQNPPVRELVDAQPDEIWVIQINPTRLDTEPRSAVEIADRRNELAGNLSLHQELHFIEKIDQLLEEGALAPDGRFRTIVVRDHRAVALPAARRARPDLQAQPRPGLHRRPHAARARPARASSSPRSRSSPRGGGRRRRDGRLPVRRRAPRVARRRSPSTAPSAAGRRSSASCATTSSAATAIDVTRKQVAGERVTWSARWHPRDAPAPVRGVIEVVFDGDRVTSLRLIAP